MDSWKGMWVLHIAEVGGLAGEQGGLDPVSLCISCQALFLDLCITARLSPCMWRYPPHHTDEALHVHLHSANPRTGVT